MSQSHPSCLYMHGGTLIGTYRSIHKLLRIHTHLWSVQKPSRLNSKKQFYQRRFSVPITVGVPPDYADDLEHVCIIVGLVIPGHFTYGSSDSFLITKYKHEVTASPFHIVFPLRSALSYCILVWNAILPNSQHASAWKHLKVPSI